MHCAIRGLTGPGLLGGHAMTYPSTADILASMSWNNVGWSAQAVTYSIPQEGSAWPGYAPGSDLLAAPFDPNYRVLTGSEAQDFRAAIDAWDKATGLTFVETADLTTPGTIRVAVTDLHALVGPTVAAIAIPPIMGAVLIPSKGDIWLDSSPSTGGEFNLMLHELGHTLGIKHPYDSGTLLPPEFQTIRYSALGLPMSQPHFAYFDFNSSTHLWDIHGYDVLPDGPMVFDLLVVQDKYGPDAGAHAGNTIYTWDAMKPILTTLNDANGIDTIDLSNHHRSSAIDLTPGHYSSIDLYPVADQIAYWQAQQVVGWNFNLVFGARTNTWTDNVGIAYSTIIENVIGSIGGDSVIGNSAANTITGMAGDDSISGGGGNDQLDGGSGVDTIGYNGARDALAVTYSNGSYHVTDLAAGSPEGGDIVLNVEYFSFAGIPLSAERALLAGNAAIGDYDGDGKADVLWRFHASGASVIWQMSGAHNTGAGGATDAQASQAYSLLGTGDFNGDGKADLLWRNDAVGTTVIWVQSGTHLLNRGTTSVQAGTDWYVAGIADYSGDGKADILWRNLASGGTVVWTMNGPAVTGGGTTDAFAPANWSVVGSGDFNGDGKADLLWRNQDDGSTLIWEENGTHLLGGGFTSAYVAAPWVVAGVADFNGDGNADILWRNVQSSQTVVWTMNGTTQSGGGLTDVVAPANWSVAGTGDFNGDGKADILWRDDANQQTTLWTMNGQHVLTSSPTDTIAPTGWVFT